MTKRNLFLLFASLYLFSCQQPIPIPDDGTSKYFQESQKPFYHGVASGDPLSDRVIIWTRVTPPGVQEVSVDWKIASDPEMTQVINSGSTMTDASKDYTVKIDADGLQAATKYYYQFEALNGKSPIGETKTTAADQTDQVKLAIVSCSNFEAGYFNAFARIAEKEDLDAVLHLGDYIYEYGVGGYGDTTLGRINLPPGEILELSDYRTRYALYRLDKDFKEVHRQHPFICIWDDHEITNNAYKEGAQNHQADEGDYQQRKLIAKQAYYEWLPIREGNDVLYRKFQFGNMVDLLMLDERYIGRTAPADSTTQADFYDESRTMLGETQLNWFFDNLKNASSTWKVIGNQVIFSDISMKGIWRSGLNLDAWDGYPFEQMKIRNFLKDNNIQNTVFVTGDTHSSWAFETALSAEAYERDSTEAVVATEFGTTSVSSANSDESYPIDTVLMAEAYIQSINPHLKYINRRDHGYLLLTLNEESATAEWMFVETVKEITDKEFLGKKMSVKNGEKRLN